MKNTNLSAAAIIRHLIEDDDFDDDFDNDIWKELTISLPWMLDEAGFTQQGSSRWTYRRSQWQEVIITHEGGPNPAKSWHLQVIFEGHIVLVNLRGSELVMARALEDLRYWPEGMFTQWDKFAASARGKTIHDESLHEAEEDDFEWDDLVGQPPIEDTFVKLGFTLYGTEGWIKRYQNSFIRIQPLAPEMWHISFWSGGLPLWEETEDTEWVRDFLRRVHGNY